MLSQHKLHNTLLYNIPAARQLLKFNEYSNNSHSSLKQSHNNWQNYQYGRTGSNVLKQHSISIRYEKRSSSHYAMADYSQLPK